MSPGGKGKGRETAGCRSGEPFSLRLEPPAAQPLGAENRMWANIRLERGYEQDTTASPLSVCKIIHLRPSPRSGLQDKLQITKAFQSQHSRAISYYKPSSNSQDRAQAYNLSSTREAEAVVPSKLQASQDYIVRLCLQQINLPM